MSHDVLCSFATSNRGNIFKLHCIDHLFTFLCFSKIVLCDSYLLLLHQDWWGSTLYWQAPLKWQLHITTSLPGCNHKTYFKRYQHQQDKDCITSAPSESTPSFCEKCKRLSTFQSDTTSHWWNEWVIIPSWEGHNTKRHNILLPSDIVWRNVPSNRKQASLLSIHQTKGHLMQTRKMPVLNEILAQLEKTGRMRV